MPLEIVPAHDVPLAEQARIFTDAFTGYVAGSFAMDAAAMARLICAQGADLCYSRFARNADGLCGFGYITRAGHIARLAGMGVVAPARRKGVARELLLHLIEEARERGDRMMVLEVIEQNPAACCLYRSENFRELSRLVGWRRAAGVSLPDPPAQVAPILEEIAPLTASQLPSSLEFPELPWQVSRHAVAKLARGRAYSSSGNVIVIDDPGGSGPIRISALSSCAPDRVDWPALRATFLAVLRRHSDREFFAPAIFPEEFGDEIFAPLGFQREPLRQFLMRRDL